MTDSTPNIKLGQKTACRIKYQGQTVSCSRWPTLEQNAECCLEALTILTGETVTVDGLAQGGGSIEAYASFGMNTKLAAKKKARSIYDYKLSDLSDDQKSHLVWRLDHKTGIGLLTAIQIAKGMYDNMGIVDIFIWAGKSDHSAKIHARKVIDYRIEDG